MSTLSAVVILMTRTTSFFKFSKSAAGVAGNTVLVCMTCTSVRKRLHMLPSHPKLGDLQGFSRGTLTKNQTVRRDRHRFILALHNLLLGQTHTYFYSRQLALGQTQVYLGCGQLALGQTQVHLGSGQHAAETDTGSSWLWTTCRWGSHGTETGSTWLRTTCRWDRHRFILPVDNLPWDRHRFILALNNLPPGQTYLFWLWTTCRWDSHGTETGSSWLWTTCCRDRHRFILALDNLPLRQKKGLSWLRTTFFWDRNRLILALDNLPLGQTQFNLGSRQFAAGTDTS